MGEEDSRLNPIELVNEKRLVELTRKLAEIPLETGNEREIGDWLVKYFEELGLTSITRLPVEEAGDTIVGIIEGKRDGPTMMLNFHIDKPDVLEVALKPLHQPMLLSRHRRGGDQPLHQLNYLISLNEGNGIHIGNHTAPSVFKSIDQGNSKSRRVEKQGMRLKERLHYTAEAQWDKETGGEVTTNGFKVSFDTPRDHSGYERHPCPDQLFLASITGCLMNTFLYYRNHMGAETRDIKISAEAEIQLVNPLGYRIKGIEAHIQVWSSKEDADLNTTCAELARGYCHLTKSIEKAIPINVTITVHWD